MSDDMNNAQVTKAWEAKRDSLKRGNLAVNLEIDVKRIAIGLPDDPTSVATRLLVLVEEVNQLKQRIPEKTDFDMKAPV